MLNFLFLNAFIGIFTAICCIWGMLVSLFDRDGRLVHIYVGKPWAKVILWVSGIGVEVRGQENVDSSVPRIYMCNHQSYFDIFALLAHLPVNFNFIVKQELMKIPLLGLAMRRAGYIGVTREDPRKAIQSIRDAAERIKTGASVLIFPEGTRSVDGKLLAFKAGGFNLALRAGCDIVPIFIKDSYRIVPKGSFKINKGSFDITFGKPVSTAGFSKRNREDLMDKVREAMIDLSPEKAHHPE